MKIGYLQRVSNQERMIRRAACAIMQPWVKSNIKEFQLWWIYGDEEMIKRHREQNDQEVINTLNRHKKGGFEYRKIDGKIVPVPIQEN